MSFRYPIIGKHSRKQHSTWASDAAVALCENFPGLAHQAAPCSPPSPTPCAAHCARQLQRQELRRPAAICAALIHSGIPRVTVKTIAQQDMQALHRIRSMKMKQRTAIINQTRSLLAEYGIRNLSQDRKTVGNRDESIFILLTVDAHGSTHSIQQSGDEELVLLITYLRR